MEVIAQTQLVIAAIFMVMAIAHLFTWVFLLLTTATLGSICYSIWVERTGGLPEISEGWDRMWKQKARETIEKTGFFKSERDPRTGEDRLVPFDLDKNHQDDLMPWEVPSGENGNRDLDLTRL